MGKFKETKKLKNVIESWEMVILHHATKYLYKHKISEISDRL